MLFHYKTYPESHGSLFLKKIMFFVGSLKIGGSEKACVRMANAFADKYDVTIRTFFGGGELRTELDPRVKVKSFLPRFVRGFARLVHILPPRFAHFLFAGSGYDAEIAVGEGLESHVISGGKCKNKYCWVHMDLRFNGPAPCEKTKKRFSAFKNIICVSQTAKDGVEVRHGFENKTVIAYTPVDEKTVVQKAEENLEFPKGHMVCVGRLEKIKGFDRLILAADMVRNLDFCIHIYGDGTKKEELSALIKEKDLCNRIILEGEVGNPYPFMRQAKALICPSENESFGFVVVEAMLLDTPVLATRCGGAEEIIGDETRGFLCSNSVEGIAEGMRDIITKVCDFDTKKARERAMEFGLENCTREFEKIIFES